VPPVITAVNPIVAETPMLSRPKYNGREIDIDRAIDIVHMNLGKQSKHTCTRAVANALNGVTDYTRASGVADPS